MSRVSPSTPTWGSSDINLEFVVNAIPALISYVDAGHRYQFNNVAYAEWFGPEAADLRGRHMRDVLGAAAYEAVRPHVEAALRGEQADFETTAPYRDGGARDIHATYIPDRDPNGTVRGFVAVVQDISDKMRAARQMRAADARLAFAANAAGFGDWSVDMATGKMELSDRAALILGLAPGRHPPGTVRAMIDPEDYESSNARVTQAIRHRTDFDVQYRITRSDGSRLWVSGRGRAVYTESGELSGVTGVVQDITAAKRIEAALTEQTEVAQRSRQAAETANRLKDEFLATVSHELRTPLNAIMGWARLLGHGTLDHTQQARAIETIERNALIQQRIIDDILDVSRIIAGKLRLEMSSIDLIPAVQAAIEAVRPSAAARDISLTTDLDANIGLVSGDSGRIQQIVWNLLSNAIKFTPKGGSVMVTLQRVGNAAEIVVADTGRGIAPEFLPHVFDRFRQGDPSTTRSHGGLGLGLAIVHHLTELHGGSVRAQSGGEGCGSTFTIRLPLAPEQSTANGLWPCTESDAEEQRTPTTVLASVHVLVVDDDSDARDLLAVVLAQSGAIVRTVSSVQDALRMMDSWLPSVIVSDIAMPVEDGYSFIEQIRSRPVDRGGTVPAAALTAYARPEDCARVLSAGYQVHIPKPVDPRDLVTAVARLARTNDPSVTG